MKKTLGTLTLCAALAPWGAALAQGDNAAKKAPKGVPAEAAGERPSGGGGGRKGLPPMSSAAPMDDTNLMVDISAKYDDLSGAAKFVAGNGTQANHVAGGDRPYVVHSGQGEGLEFKKWGFIVNVLPVLDPSDRGKVRIQIQVELSGPVKGVKVRENDVPALTTWQLQTSQTLVLGRRTVIAESPARVEIMVDEAK